MPGQTVDQTHDTAVWKPASDLPHPAAEIEDRFDRGEAPYPHRRTPIPELVRLAERLVTEFEACNQAQHDLVEAFRSVWGHAAASAYAERSTVEPAQATYRPLVRG